MKRTSKLHAQNGNERKTKTERTIHATETNEKRNSYEISIKLNDPGSVLPIRQREHLLEPSARDLVIEYMYSHIPRYL